MNTLISPDRPRLSEAALVYRAGRRRFTAECMHRKAESGIFPGCPPLGYMNVQVQGKRTIDLAPGWGLVEQAFELADRKDYSLRALLEIMTKKGLRSRKGTVMGISAFWGILTNPFYTGILEYGGKTVKGAHPPIVSKQRFARVQEKLHSKKRKL